MWKLKNNSLFLDGHIVAQQIPYELHVVLDKLIRDIERLEEENAESKELLAKREELLTRLLERAGKDGN